MFNSLLEPLTLICLKGSASLSLLLTRFVSQRSNFLSAAPILASMQSRSLLLIAQSLAIFFAKAEIELI